MNGRTRLASIFTFLAAVSVACASLVSAAGNQPNILLIQADDLGFDDLSINGNTCSRTPNIDQLAETSVRFSNFMVNSVCSPTRGSLLTGRDYWRTGGEGLHGCKEFLHLDERTFANAFQDAGYATGMWGKWHNGKADGYWPWDRGFDDGYYAKLYQYFPSSGYYNGYPKQVVHEGEWSPKVLTDYTIDFISRNKDNEKPFLAYLSFLTCHSTWNTPDRYRNKYLKDGQSDTFATLLGMLEFMDDQVGRVLEHLSDLGLDENTVVVFISDNGPNKGGSKNHKGADVLSEAEWALRNNHGFLGSKSKLWQNGIKSPLFVRWKGRYRPADVERLVTVTDVFPTLLDIASIELPRDNPALDGRSIKPYLEGDTKSLDEKRAVFTHWHPTWEGDHYDPLQDKTALDAAKQKMTLINEHYKLIQNEYAVPGSPKHRKGVILIDLKADPMERTNVAETHPQIVRTMQSELKLWFSDVVGSFHSFTPTVFQIGWNGKASSEVLAFGPSKTVGVKNTSHVATGWDAVGDHAEYRIHVHRAGTYNVSLKRLAKKNETTAVVVVSCNGKEVRSKLKHTSSQLLGAMHLDAGEHTLRVEIAAIESGEPSSLQIKALKFDRS
ncbi:sucrose phosphorylase domain-containing protein [Stieleria bergensis]